MNQDRKTEGFTLIELMLAMSFISILLIAIAMTVIQISNIYTRGLTLKEVNQAGRSLASELQDGIAASSLFSVNTSEVGAKFVQKDFGGRLCVGKYSYIWNYGSTLSKSGLNSSNSNIFDSDDPDFKVGTIRFVKVADSTAKYCSASAAEIDPTGAVEMLDVGDRNLAIHKFSISAEPSAIDSITRQGLYYISFVVGTNDQATLATDQSTCKIPSDMASDLNYCSVNQFDIVARAGNAVQ